MGSRTDKEILISARQRIEKPNNWMQGEFSNIDFTKFCATGSLLEEGREIRSSAYARLHGAMGLASNQSVCSYNDTHTHAEVIAAFDKAIEMAR